jgi:hypothetical protein
MTAIDFLGVTVLYLGFAGKYSVFVWICFDFVCCDMLELEIADGVVLDKYSVIGRVRLWLYIMMVMMVV